MYHDFITWNCRRRTPTLYTVPSPAFSSLPKTIIFSVVRCPAAVVRSVCRVPYSEENCADIAARRTDRRSVGRTRAKARIKEAGLVAGRPGERASEKRPLPQEGDGYTCLRVRTMQQELNPLYPRQVADPSTGITAAAPYYRGRRDQLCGPVRRLALLSLEEKLSVWSTENKTPRA